MFMSKVGWLLLSFFVITAALALWDDLPKRFQDWRTEATGKEVAASALRGGRDAFKGLALQRLTEAEAEVSRLKRAGSAELSKAEDEVAVRQREAGARVLDGPALALAAARGRTDEITASYLARHVDLPLLERSAAFIALLRANLRTIAERQIKLRSLEKDLKSYNEAVGAYNRELSELAKKRAQAKAQWRNPLCRRVEVPRVCNRVTQVKQKKEELQEKKRELNTKKGLLEDDRKAIERLLLRREQVSDGAAYVETATKAHADYATSLAEESADHTWNQMRQAVERHGWGAFWIVLGAVMLPILHKLFAFLVIAPMAQRARPVRLRQDGPPLSASASGLSVKVPIDRDSDLLLRSGLQSSAGDTKGGDEPLLDWRMPLTCIAAGLVNLQRLRSDVPDYVVVTGTHETHRVATIVVPAGGAVVLQPRALLGVLKPRDRRLVVTRPWRVGWLISWITVQFRYIVFHGPCTLIVQGMNGVEVEDAARGRMINKRLTLGFDAALAYSAVRSTSFLPYLYGQASLFNDRFEGAGSYLFEQRAAGASRGGLWGRGLKGIGDAALGAFGI